MFHDFHGVPNPNWHRPNRHRIFFPNRHRNHWITAKNKTSLSFETACSGNSQRKGLGYILSCPGAWPARAVITSNCRERTAIVYDFYIMIFFVLTIRSFLEKPNDFDQ